MPVKTIASKEAKDRLEDFERMQGRGERLKSLLDDDDKKPGIVA